MTIKELAMNWLQNDRTGNYERKITLTEACEFIWRMDPDTLNVLDEPISSEKFMNAWNELIEEEN